MWSVTCRVWIIKDMKVWSVEECKVWSVELGEWGMLSVACRVWSGDWVECRRVGSGDWGM